MAAERSSEARVCADRNAVAIDQIVERYRHVRGVTEALCAPLATEDYVVQSMPDVSPTKWHLAHTTWFFETFVLLPSAPTYRSFHPQFGYLFNSYYNAVGSRHCRARRGLLTRPTVDEVFDYRRHVDRALIKLLEAGALGGDELLATITLGVHHEQQHQELILTDIKHVFSCNPLRPSYTESVGQADSPGAPLAWVAFPERLGWLGHDGAGFAYDNETPRHRVFGEAFALASRPVTNGEFLRFIDAGGYSRADLWLSDGWNAVQGQQWCAPLYWERREGRWWAMTLSGMRELDMHEPVCHVSFYEADAYARWAGTRLPTEAEWETAATTVDVAGHFADSGRLHPAPAVASPTSKLTQVFGDVWEWTKSAYAAYPGYHQPAGAFGEYNGKFMCNQLVLRGGSCVTPPDHIRATYRNFFPPDARWQFSGIRLARDM